MDDWQSVYVLLSLLRNSRNQLLRDRAVHLANRSIEVCKGDSTKMNFLLQVLEDLKLPIPPDYQSEQITL